MTAEDWAPYGIGEPDADGWYQDYRPVPAHLKPESPNAVTSQPKHEVDDSWLAIVTHWRLVVADLAAIYHLDIHDPAVRARPWPGVRTMIFALFGAPESRLRKALTRR